VFVCVCVCVCFLCFLFFVFFCFFADFDFFIYGRSPLMVCILLSEFKLYKYIERKKKFSTLTCFLLVIFFHPMTDMLLMHHCLFLDVRIFILI
jgi:hypothetical protein